MSSATAQANAEGLPEIDLSEHLLTKGDLALRSHSELFEIAAILRAAADLMAYSRYSGLLGEITGTLVSLARDARDAAETRHPANRTEANWRGWLIVSHAAYLSESLSDIAVLAAEASAAERHAPAIR
ncbi:hypothetical protein [Bosea sp. UC22_33]|uniref:hypothetical protein n=1 Tax=Bosea sp. UC22_33 TaxID=3350165 RepID=UPI00367227F0